MIVLLAQVLILIGLPVTILHKPLHVLVVGISIVETVQIAQQLLGEWYKLATTLLLISPALPLI
jgi:hypothetical protein